MYNGGKSFNFYQVWTKFKHYLYSDVMVVLVLVLYSTVWWRFDLLEDEATRLRASGTPYSTFMPCH